MPYGPNEPYIITNSASYYEEYFESRFGKREWPLGRPQTKETFEDGQTVRNPYSGRNVKVNPSAALELSIQTH